MTESTQAVFVSYASQDAPAAQRICEALRAAGIEVWFDQSELRGGDLWDQKIRREIHACALFIPVISHHTQERLEGYFRREWKLAVERTHDMAEQKHFLLPVVVDATSDREAIVPDLFRAVQWSRLPAGATPAFVELVKHLLAPRAGTPSPAFVAPPARPTAISPASVAATPSWVGRLLATIAALVLATAAYFAVEKAGILRRSASPAVAAGVGGFSPPPHSVAVLPFINMSGDKEQEYFSEGLTEELLNSLAEIDGLQVAARTSAFSFQGTNTDLATIARKLNVGSVLEGSVRRSGHTVRITAQLIDAISGFHLWSKSYDRDLGDVLQLQSDIATAVAEALKVTLLGDVSARIELGGTRNPAAFDAYLRGLKLSRLAAAVTPMQCRAPMDAFSQAISLDADFALAYANRALIATECADNSTDWLQQPHSGTGGTDAERAITLAPKLADGYVASSRLAQGALKFEAANQACARALVLGPGNVQVLHECSLLAAYMGQADGAITGARRAVALDPLNPLSHRALGDVLRYARRYQESAAAYQDSIAADPDNAADAYGLRGLSLYLAGDASAAQASCEKHPDSFRNRICRAVVYEKLGRHADAAAVAEKLMDENGDAAAYQYAEIFAQFGNQATALDWLEKANRLHDPGLVYTKVDPLMDPLRSEPRFRAVLQGLQFPQ